MRKLFMAAAVATAGFTQTAAAEDITVGVSWSNFQEERWKTDEAAIKAALAVLYLLQQTARDQIRGDGGHRPGADVELARHIHARHLPVRADLFKHLLAQRACIILRQGQQRATA